MDTVGIDVPRATTRVERRIAAALVAIAATVALAGGYALGVSSVEASPTQTIIARGLPATWQNAVDEANAVKRHTAEARRAGPVDVRLARVER